MIATSNKEMQSMSRHSSFQAAFYRNLFINIKFSQPLQTLREFNMLRVMEGITDTPEWYKMVCWWTTTDADLNLLIKLDPRK